jgi:hypothetical protein
LFDLVHQFIRGRNGVFRRPFRIQKCEHANAASDPPPIRIESLLQFACEFEDDLLGAAAGDIGENQRELIPSKPALQCQ